MNYFMIGGDKREYGPVDTELIRQWLKEGRANGETLLRLENETVWKPLREFPEFQEQFNPDAERTPEQPPPLPNTIHPSQTPVRVGHAFARAWHLVGEHFGVVFASTLLVWLVMTAPLLVPCAGLLTPLFFGPLYGGLFMVFLKLIREGDASPNDALALTRERALPLMLAGLVFQILTALGAYLCCFLPGIYLYIAWLFGIPLVADRGMGFWEGLEASRRVITRQWFRVFGLFLLSFLPVVVFSLYLAGRLGADIWPHAQELWQSATRATEGAIDEAEMRKILLEIEGVERGYMTWQFMKQILLLISLPLGIGSLAFVYEDLFGRKR